MFVSFSKKPPLEGKFEDLNLDLIGFLQFGCSLLLLSSGRMLLMSSTEIGDSNEDLFPATVQEVWILYFEDL